MNINFVMVTTYEGSYIEIPNINYTFIPSLDFDQAKPKYRNQLRNSLIDEKTLSFVRALEKNKDFEKAVKSFRKECDIPENGYEYKEWIELDEHRVEHSLGFERSRYDEHYRKIILSDVFEKITHKFSIPSILHASIPHIIAANVIYVPLHRIELELDGQPKAIYDVPSIKISLRDFVSKNELLNFIDEKWELIQENMDKFTSFDKIYISERDYEILRLRDEEKLKYGDIAGILEDRGLGSFNEDLVKTAYHTAKAKIAKVSET